MKRTGLFAVVTAISMSLSAAGASAQSLTDTLIAAYRNSYQLLAERANLRATDEGVAQAWAGFRPSVNLSASSTASYRQVTSVLAPNNWTYTHSLSLTSDLMLWDGGASRLRHQIAKLNVEIGRQTLQLTEQTVLLDAVTSFMDMRRDAEFLQLAENNYRVIERQVQAANDRFEVGEVRRTDVNQAEARLAGALSVLALRQGNLEISREYFHISTGTYPGVLQLPPPAPRIPATVAAAKAIAMRSHPNILRAQQVAKIAGLNVAIAEAVMKPNIRLQGSLGVSSTTSTGKTASVGLSATAPIYQGGTLASQHRQALALRQKADSDVQLAGLGISQAVTQAWTMLETSRASITARQKEVRASRVALRGIREEANLGARTTLDVLDAEQVLVEAEANLVAARRDEYVAVYSLLSAMGLLTVSHLQLGVETYDPTINSRKTATAPGPTDRGKLLQKIFTRAGE